jgi:hypothetical protein
VRCNMCALGQGADPVRESALNPHKQAISPQ